MKKYVKPELFYERFELNQQIAACDYDLNPSTDGQCGFTGHNTDFGESITIFLSESDCDFVADSYCYHNASASPWGIYNS